MATAKITVSHPVLGTGTQVFSNALQVRKSVFVEEQGLLAENEIDANESRCWHWAAYSPTGQPIGSIRLVTPPHSSHAEGPEHKPEGNYIKLGRLATLKECRGKGVARLLVNAAVEFAKTNPGEVGCRRIEDGSRIEGEEWDGRMFIHAQTNIKRVWQKMGFVEDTALGEWIEQGVFHLCGMWREG